jgi:GT2 family glycosyltransferase
MVVTGMVCPAELDTEAQIIFEKDFGGFHGGYTPRVFDQMYFKRHKHFGVPVWSIGAGANMAIRRSVFERIGGFDEILDAGAAGCSGDSEFWYRVLAEGWICLYNPVAVVHHYHRRELQDLRRQMRAYMRGHVAALLIQFERYHHIGNLIWLFFRLPAHYLVLAIAAATRGWPSGDRILLGAARGCWSGVRFYLKHHRRPAGPTRAAFVLESDR